MTHRPTDFEELDARPREVLREIILQYVAHGEPVSSRSLSKSGRFGLSPASLRNVMADLEEMGLLCQPHTSAGRIPTDSGYRFFINHLMKARKLAPSDRERIDDHVARVGDLDEGMQHLSKLLSELTNQVGIVFMPTLQHIVMRSIDFISVAEHRVLCVIVGGNGVVINKIIETKATFTRAELESIGRFLTGQYSGTDLETIRGSLDGLLGQERARYDEFLHRTATLGIEAVDEVVPHENELFLEGASSILRQPEYSDPELRRRISVAFDDREKLVEILSQCLNEEGLQILIGSESLFTRNYNLSLVAARYGSASPLGLVGIIGPTRMEYSRVGPLVEYLGRALSLKIEESTQEE